MNSLPKTLEMLPKFNEILYQIRNFTITKRGAQGTKSGLLCESSVTLNTHAIRVHALRLDHVSSL